MRTFKVVTVAIGCLASAMQIRAGSSAAPARAFTLPEAVQYATEHYPTVRAAIERRNAARAAVSLARDKYLPHADVVWQLNRATRNNVAGSLLPQSTIPNPSGTVLDASTQSFWGTGTGMQISWEPFDFGYRHATVDAAQAKVRRTTAQLNLTLLDVQTAAADAALSVLAAEQSVHAAQADVERRRVFGRSVHALVNAKMRPGADASRADAELATARTREILAEENAGIARATLAELLDLAGTDVDVAPGGLLGAPPPAPAAAVPASSHPLAIVEQNRVVEAQAQVNILCHAYAPKFAIEGIGYGRGTGVNGNGKPATDPQQGLVPDTPNWAAGVTVKFAIFDIASIHSRKKIAQANQHREEQYYNQALQTVSGRAARAQARLEGSRRVAENTPAELRASEAAESQARARFHAGLATLVDVAEAQRLLVTAQIDDSLARLSIWRAMERLAAAEGNLQPFVDQVESADHGAGTGVK